MINENGTNHLKWKHLAGLSLALTLPGLLPGQSASELEERIAALEAELQEARNELMQARETALDAEERAEVAETRLANAADAGPSKIQLGNFAIGGAIRANYTIGDYANGSGPSRGGDGGNFNLDTFRVNVDYANDQLIGKLEYRWYNGYNFLHTGWVGYELDEASQLQIGVNRVPFGAGPYGTYNSWIADQHYYVGLADDMDLGVKYSTVLGNLKLDLAYYVSDEGQWRGASRDSARYSYDPVLWSFDGNVSGYEERHTFNARGIFLLAQESSMPTEAGMSLQYGQLEATDTSGGDMDDGEHYALSGHIKTSLDALTLQAQLSYYHYDIDDDNPWGDDELLPFGAFDFPWPVAAEAMVLSLSGAYYIPTPDIDWLDSVNTYIEYSTIQKSEDAHNDSDMLTIGAAWWRGGWYIYTEWAYSNGNYFVGSEGDDYSTFGGVGDFGINGNDTWNSRFNINFGYYF